MTKTFSIILCLMSLSGFAQVGKKSTQVEDSLKTELRKATAILGSTRKELDRLTYLLTAKEMAIRSTELKDSIFQALVSLQAYNFNKKHNGDPADIDIYRALYKSLEKFQDPLIKTLTFNVKKTDKDISNTSDSMATKLCSHIKRNMTVDQWNTFADHLPYEQTCETTK